LNVNFQSYADEALSKLMEPIRKKYDLPSMAVMILDSKGIVASDISGVRKVGTDIPVTLHDKWHLGSNTKAMTATLVARFIDQGKLTWETRLDKIFPEFAPHFHPGFKDVTLLHLLTHSSGIPTNMDYNRILKEGSVQKQRLILLKEALEKQPEHPLGTKNIYSNTGYIILGAALEKVSGSTWENLIQTEIFSPLQMRTAGFGGTGTLGRIDQPWGHYSSGKPTKINGPTMDNGPFLGPAGRVHCSIEDWSKFIADQLRGARGQDGLLKSATYTKLLKPFIGNRFACGWGLTKNDIVGDTVLSHAGTNTMNYSYAVIAPSQDFAVLICTNQGGDNIRKVCVEVADLLLTFQMEKLKAAK
jgi:CubicO group peptidase (beta-lactamase class C family)